MKELFTKTDKVKLTFLILKAVFGTAGGALVIAEGHPYLATMCLCIAAGANEANTYLQKNAKA